MNLQMKIVVESYGQDLPKIDCIALKLDLRCLLSSFKVRNSMIEFVYGGIIFLRINNLELIGKEKRIDNSWNWIIRKYHALENNIQLRRVCDRSL